jgi:hypothetical protein
VGERNLAEVSVRAEPRGARVRADLQLRVRAEFRGSQWANGSRGRSVCKRSPAEVSETSDEKSAQAESKVENDLHPAPKCYYTDQEPAVHCRFRRKQLS